MEDHSLGQGCLGSQETLGKGLGPELPQTAGP